MSEVHVHSRSEIAKVEETARFTAGVYKWMTIGLSVTAATSYYVATSESFMSYLMSNIYLFYGLLIAELIAVIGLSAMVNKMSAQSATLIYFVYCILTGVTLSVISLIYTSESIMSAFLLTSFSFAGLSLFGYVTKKDLGPIGTFCNMGLWGLIGFGILTLFFPNLMTSQTSMIYGLVGIVVFSGLTAYDTQK